MKVKYLRVAQGGRLLAGDWLGQSLAHGDFVWSLKLFSFIFSCSCRVSLYAHYQNAIVRYILINVQIFSKVACSRL